MKKCDLYPRSADDILLSITSLQEEKRRWAVVKIENNVVSIVIENTFQSQALAQDFCTDLNRSRSRKSGEHYIVVPVQMKMEVL